MEDLKALEVSCKYFLHECGNEQIQKLKKEKAKAHKRTFAGRQENARLRNELWSTRRALERACATITFLQQKDQDIQKCLNTLLLQMEAK